MVPDTNVHWGDCFWITFKQTISCTGIRTKRLYAKLTLRNLGSPNVFMSLKMKLPKSKFLYKNMFPMLHKCVSIYMKQIQCVNRAQVFKLLFRLGRIELLVDKG